MNLSSQVRGSVRLRSCWFVLFALICGCLLLGAQPAMAQDACAGAIPVGTATGCGAIITVTSVDANHNGNGFTVTKPTGGNGNPYDGTEDTLIGIVNMSGADLNSITLSSPNTTFGGLFGFDNDGPCNPTFHVPNWTPYAQCPGATGYEGPINTFTVPGEVGPFTTGTVNFNPALGNGQSTWFALEGTPDSLTLTQQQPMTFTPANPSAVATFNCSTNTVPCPDQGANSVKFTLASVSTAFTITLQATEVDGDGICESGIPGDPSDPIDCRFVRYFGEPAFTTGTITPNTKVPQCYAYSSSTAAGTKHCVFYHVANEPPPPGATGSPYTGPVTGLIAWNTVQNPPAGYINSPRAYDDPSDDNDFVHYPTIRATPFNSFPYTLNQAPYTAQDNQFVFDITTFFNPGATVGTDPGTGTKGGSFNDYVVAFPFTLAQVQQPINPDGSSVFNASKGVTPVKFTLTQDGAATCNLPPATISLFRVAGAGMAGAIDESIYSMAADNGNNFRISSCQYIYNLQSSALGPGQYKVGISINNEVVGVAYFALK
jgi:hypothetical protein